MSTVPNEPQPTPVKPKEIAKESQPIDHHREESPGGGVDPKLEGYFQAMVKLDAGDLHIKSGSTVHVRVGSSLRQIKEPPLNSREIERMAWSLMTAEQKEYFHKFGSVDLAHELSGSDRYRINIFRQRGEVSLSVRRVTRNIPNFENLHLPPEMAQIVEADQGLILLAGPTGCGKSTTIASMIEYINTHRRCHIITIEDPIEYLYEDKKSLISQREIGIDVPNFPTALRAMLREDPDVVLIGEMRDYETFEAAIQASETGHLVFGTVHASSA
ncbi:MAG: Flp pilus assembly complex ATPase component TadA, partial [Phycisphaerae bacterium]|nr:Flp pilus assembly complex ATPase component TadA [Phycisphaerae bacterium]